MRYGGVGLATFFFFEMIWRELGLLPPANLPKIWALSGY